MIRYNFTTHYCVSLRRVDAELQMAKKFLTELIKLYFNLICIVCGRICAGCNTEIGHGRFLSCMSAVWHPECFRCNGCSQPISDYEVPNFIWPSWNANSLMQCYSAKIHMAIFVILHMLSYMQVWTTYLPFQCLMLVLASFRQ